MAGQSVRNVISSSSPLPSPRRRPLMGSRPAGHPCGSGSVGHVSLLQAVTADRLFAFAKRLGVPFRNPRRSDGGRRGRR